MFRKNLKSSRFIGDFEQGDIYHHGAIQITPSRNREYIKKFSDGFLLGANPELSEHLGLNDPDLNEKQKFSIRRPGLVSQGYLFNIGFGLSVHDISFNAIANLSYNCLYYGTPVYEGDTVHARSQVIGKEFRKDNSRNGSVQILTTVSNQNDETVLEYVRQVLVKAEHGRTYSKEDTTMKQPEKIEIRRSALPPVFKRLDSSLLGNAGKTFDDMKIGDVLKGTFERYINLVDFSWLQISTLNDAAVHHDIGSGFIGYGGAVKSLAEGQISAHLPVAYQLGMNNGTHNGPTYPGDIINNLYSDVTNNDDHEKIRSRAVILNKENIDGRDDAGIVTLKLTADKRVTDAGMKALEAVNYRGIDRIYEEDGKRYLRVLTTELVMVVPSASSFS